MYEAYWGLARPPFTATAARAALAASPIHAEALARLEFLAQSGSPLGLLVGHNGSGKSGVLAEFAQRAARLGNLVACTNAAGADEDHLLPLLVEALGERPSGDRWTTWRRLADRLAELPFDGLRAVVLLDDLDRALPGALALAERLLALSAVPLTIIAAARPATASRLGGRILEQAALRIELSNWNEAESREHLERSMHAAGRVQPAFADAAARRLFELSAGAPRRLNQLAQLALLAGAGQQAALIDAATIEAVNEELCLPLAGVE